MGGYACSRQQGRRSRCHGLALGNRSPSARQAACSNGPGCAHWPRSLPGSSPRTSIAGPKRVLSWRGTTTMLEAAFGAAHRRVPAVVVQEPPDPAGDMARALEHIDLTLLERAARVERALYAGRRSRFVRVRRRRATRWIAVTTNSTVPSRRAPPDVPGATAHHGSILQASARPGMSGCAVMR
jgi:hypothetical protein